ncbi:hypothetical protein [Clostridium tyrobutyricum]|uniref:hypothetical protein n=1 Tax=Clostridium tyrobutyricum TaxID=1519 RepID=UPI0018AC1599|nr:hypothetical protein [Clostridium tyrobutyricum]
MNKIDEKALEHQTIPSKCINELREYCKDKFETTGGIAMFSTCINYGIMIGKRQEKAKYKTELEKAKMKNIRLISFIYEIKKIAEETLKIL